MLPDKVSAIIIRDKKILLVTGGNHPFFWTPGGKIEPTESHETAMARELQEELCLSVLSMRSYLEYTTINEATGKKQNVHCYLVQYIGEIFPDHEITTYGWFFKEELPVVTQGIKNHILPKLLHDGLL